MQPNLLTDSAPAGPFPILLDAAAAAKALGVSRSQFWRLHSAGRLPMPIRALGRRCPRWNYAELVAFVGAGCPPRDVWEKLKREPQ